jgi:hypothetical protein
MPSPFKSIGNAVRNHPVIVASWAATAGVLLGGFVTVQVLAPDRPVEKIGPGTAVAESKSEPKPAAEPVASAGTEQTTGQDVASTRCEQQTWPHLSSDCLDAMGDKNRAARVITTDRIDPPAVAPAAPKPADPVPVKPAVAAAPIPPATSPAAAVAETPKKKPEPAPASTVFAAPEGAPDKLATGAESVPAASAEKVEKKEAKQERKKHKRKARPEPKFIEPAEDEDGERAVAVDSSDDEVVDNRRTARVSRAERRRTVERRIVPRDADDEDGPFTDGRGERGERVIVIRRGGGGLFGNLFGGFD